jgi:hypothetical protein
VHVLHVLAAVDWGHQAMDALFGGLATALFGAIYRRLHRVRVVERRVDRLEAKYAAITGEVLEPIPEGDD